MKIKKAFFKIYEEKEKEYLFNKILYKNKGIKK